MHVSLLAHVDRQVGHTGMVQTGTLQVAGAQGHRLNASDLSSIVPKRSWLNIGRASACLKGVVLNRRGRTTSEGRGRGPSHVQWIERRQVHI